MSPSLSVIEIIKPLKGFCVRDDNELEMMTRAHKQAGKLMLLDVKWRSVVLSMICSLLSRFTTVVCPQLPSAIIVSYKMFNANF